MNLSKTSIRVKATLLAAVTATFIMSPTHAQKNDYSFAHHTTPSKLRPYSAALFMTEGSDVTNLVGTKLAQSGKPIEQLAVSPAGIDMIILVNNGKGKEAWMYSLYEPDKRLHKASVKKLGEPTAIGYTHDARNVLLATDMGLHIIEPKKFTVIETMPLDFRPTNLLASSDGYFLVCSDDHNVVVYNFEERKPRKTWKFDEKITTIEFNEDNSDLGILTDDGLLTIYDTRNFGLRHTVDDLGEATDFDFNFDGKYVAVIVGSDKIAIINLLHDSEREFIDVPYGNATDLVFFPDSFRNTLLANNTLSGVNVKRIVSMIPFYGKLMADEVAERMNEWLKMMPGESMDEYRARVTDETRARQQRLFEDEISTNLANNLLSMSTISLGKYDRAGQMLEVDFDNMPSIFLPVPEADLADFNNSDDLEFSDAKYGIMPDDNFELIYAKITNKGSGKSYIYDNLDRKPLSFLEGDENVVSIAMIQQQQMEEMKLQELRRQVVEDAKTSNLISDNTHITVNSRVEPSFDANGEKILNYVISFTYEVEPDFSVKEDFGPGKYHIEESGAATAMLRIVKEAFEGDFAQYLKDGKKLNIKISGTADGTPIVRPIRYDGVYGDFEDEIVYKDGQLSGISVNTREGIKENEQLAFLRAFGVRDYLTKNIDQLNKLATDYQYHIGVAEGKGAEFRRITTDFTFVDAF